MMCKTGKRDTLGRQSCEHLYKADYNKSKWTEAQKPSA